VINYGVIFKVPGTSAVYILFVFLQDTTGALLMTQTIQDVLLHHLRVESTWCFQFQ